MDMNRFHGKHDRVVANSGTEFADIPKLVCQQGAIVRLIGDFATNWEHFVNTERGPRPYYCEGPESDCPICQAANKLAMSDDKQRQEMAQQIRAREKFYFNCLDRSPAGTQWHDANKKSYLLTQNSKSMNIGSMLFQAIGNVVKMRQQQRQPDDPNTYDIMLTKTGQGMQTKYGAQFTGDVTELTDEEKKYDLWPVDQIAKISPLNERQSVADFILGKGPSHEAKAVEFNPADYQAQGPVEQAVQQPQQPAPAPVAAAVAAAPKATLTPKTAHQTTEPRQADMSHHMEVPCSQCSTAMLIDMNDLRDIKCHKCGAEYQHPNNQG